MLVDEHECVLAGRSIGYRPVAIIGRFPRYIHQLSSRPALPKTVLSISSGLKDHRVLFRRRSKNNRGEKGGKRKNRWPPTAEGKRTMSSSDAELARVRSARTFLAMPAHYSSLPLTGNYAEWELSLSKWASIVPTIHTVMLPYPTQ